MRDAGLHISMTPTERDAVRALARAEGLSTSAYVRRRLLGDDAPERHGAESATPDGGPRRHRKVCATDGEWERIRAVAARAGMSVSELVRTRCLNPGAALVAVDDDALRGAHYESVRQGVNINQIARRLNGASRDELPARIAETLPLVDAAMRENRELTARLREILGTRRRRRGA